MSSEPTVEKPRSLAPAWVALALLFAFLGWFKWTQHLVVVRALGGPGQSMNQVGKKTFPVLL